LGPFEGPQAEFSGGDRRTKTLVAYRGNAHGSRASGQRLSGCFCRFESTVGFRSASFGTGDRSEVIMLLDIFYIGVAVAFFVVLWGFTKAAERL
jgi:hypothetical protein